MSTSTPPQSAGAYFLAWLPELVIDAACPYLTFLVLTHRGLSTVAALSAGAVFPALFVAGRCVRRRHLDGLGIIVLAGIGLSAGLSLLTGSSRLVQVKESFFTGAFGLAMLGSLVVAPRPMMYYFGRKFATDGSPEGMAAWESYWPKSPTFRHSNRMMTIVWGSAFVAEAGARVIGAYTLAASTVVGLSGLIPLAVLALLMAWTFAYSKRVRPLSRAEVAAFG